MSHLRATMTPEEIGRVRELDRARQARRRARSKAGDMLVRLPAEIADEFEDEAAVLEILRRVAARARDGA